MQHMPKVQDSPHLTPQPCLRFPRFVRNIISLVHQDEDEEAESDEESSEAESSDTSSSSSDEELIDRADLPARQTDQHVDVGLKVSQACAMVKVQRILKQVPPFHRRVS